MSKTDDFTVQLSSTPQPSEFVRLVILTFMALCLGFQLACGYLIALQLDSARERNELAVKAVVAAQQIRERADADLERAQALLGEAEAELRKQSRRTPRPFAWEGRNAGQVSSL